MVTVDNDTLEFPVVLKPFVTNLLNRMQEEVTQQVSNDLLSHGLTSWSGFSTLVLVKEDYAAWKFIASSTLDRTSRLMSVSLYMSAVVADLRFMRSTKVTPMSFNKTVAIIFRVEVADCFRFLSFSELEWRHYIDWCFRFTLIYEILISPPVIMWENKLSQSHRSGYKKGGSEIRKFISQSTNLQL